MYVSSGAGPAIGAANASAGAESATVAGGGVSLHAAAGYAAVDGLATAAEVRAILHNGVAQFNQVESDFDIGIASIGALVDWYPRPLGPVHLQLGFGRMSAAKYGLTSGGAETKSATPSSNLGTFSDMHGPLGHVGVGWAWRARDGVAFTPVFDLYRGRATNDEASLDVYGCSLELMLTWL
jgi:hypothetical protein